MDFEFSKKLFEMKYFLRFIHNHNLIKKNIIDILNTNIIIIIDIFINNYYIIKILKKIS